VDVGSSGAHRVGLRCATWPFPEPFRANSGWRESRPEPFLRRACTRPELAGRILELATEHGEVTAGGVIRATGAPRGTVKKRLGELAAAGKLRLVGKGRGAR
jgi:hypothetical protein